MNILPGVSKRYEFGQNWQHFAEGLSSAAIDQAVLGMRRLIPVDEISGRDVLDIGCGSGLHALAALRLGASSVTAIDIDEDSVSTTRQLLSLHAPPGAIWSATVKSVFELETMPQYPVVYSWGVLHHTGDMYAAIRCAADRVAPDGGLYLALYRKTPLCCAWRVEKWLYTNSPRRGRHALEATYVAAFRLAMTIQGRNFQQYVTSYLRNRGMNWMTDVRDWLGGYPYQSISEKEMLSCAHKLGFSPIRVFCRKPGIGLFGTGCDEYAFRKL
jgi:2-polyprenyl-6-hydroxyphenyl methylase/3-demethylubiquinone-9 3-methyltransferase